MGMVNGGGQQRSALQVSAWPRKEHGSKHTTTGVKNGHALPAFGPLLREPRAPSAPKEILSRALRDELTDLRGELDRLLRRGRVGQNGIASRLKALEVRLEQACAMAQGPEAKPAEAGLAPLHTCLEAIAKAFTSHAGIPCQVLIDDHPSAQVVPSLSEEQRQILKGILSEALSNVARHAHADSATIHASSTEDGLRITVSDDGWGLCPAAAERRQAGGLARMRADAAAVGGQLEIQTPLSGGTRVICSIPAVGLAAPAAL